MDAHTSLRPRAAQVRPYRRRLAAATALAVSLAVAATAPAAEPRVYVLSGQPTEVSEIDVVDLGIARQLELPSVKTEPRDLAVNAARTRLYVSEPAARRLARLDLKSGDELKPIDVPGRPSGLAVTADGTNVGIALVDSGKPEPFAAIAVLDVASESLVEDDKGEPLLIPVPGLYSRLATGLAEADILVADFSGGQVYAVDLAAGDYRLLNQPSAPTPAVVSLAAEAKAKRVFLAGLSYSVVRLDGKGRTASAPVQDGPPVAVAFHADTRRVFAAHDAPQGEIVVYDPDSLAVVATHSLAGARAAHLAAAAKAVVHLPPQSSHLTVLDAATLELRGVLKAPSFGRARRIRTF